MIIVEPYLWFSFCSNKSPASNDYQTRVIRNTSCFHEFFTRKKDKNQSEQMVCLCSAPHRNFSSKRSVHCFYYIMDGELATIFIIFIQAQNCWDAVLYAGPWAEILPGAAFQFLSFSGRCCWVWMPAKRSRSMENQVNLICQGLIYK